MIRSFATLMAVLAAPALAACPTVENLGKGIKLTLNDGQTEIHKTAPGGVIQVDVRFNDNTGDGTIMHFAHGVYLRDIIPIEGGVIRVGQQERLTSEATLRTWPEPIPGARWSNPNPDGGSARSGRAKTTRIGGCSYNSFEVTLTFKDDPNYTETYAYLPDLGVGLLVESVEGSSREKYRYVAIVAQ
ncbi:MAG: hypothetical protein AAF601_15620 [Pseudomonadota bacterium]